MPVVPQGQGSCLLPSEEEHSVWTGTMKRQEKEGR